MQRLQKVLAGAGVASRRGAERLIAEGRVKVDGNVVTTLGTQIDPDVAALEVDGEIVSVCAHHSFTYLLMNKPRGLLCSRSDPHHSRTVYDLLPPEYRHLHYVGRLDKDSEGLLLFTDDGNLTYRLTHPSRAVEKTYLVEVEGILAREELRRLRSGIRLDDGLTAPARARIISKRGAGTTVEITIHEGRKRQVRRMLEAVGGRATRLTRTGLGTLSLGALKSGQFRLLPQAEMGRIASREFPA
ncbi:MAG: pseudouridine synthase [Armatimonadetes bacterium CG_4_9_14_3_um_filter_58_7]|nr:MAG: pseudouridine synthase [Armatimonadetes bacterium CG_4_9_14_3_um_filter_58_7]